MISSAAADSASSSVSRIADSSGAVSRSASARRLRPRPRRPPRARCAGSRRTGLRSMAPSWHHFGSECTDDGSDCCHTVTSIADETLRPPESAPDQPVRDLLRQPGGDQQVADGRPDLRHHDGTGETDALPVGVTGDADRPQGLLPARWAGSSPAANCRLSTRTASARSATASGSAPGIGSPSSITSPRGGSACRRCASPGRSVRRPGRTAPTGPCRSCQCAGAGVPASRAPWVASMSARSPPCSPAASCGRPAHGRCRGRPARRRWRRAGH